MPPISDLPTLIPTEPVGSIPRPLALIQALASKDGDDPQLEPLYDDCGFSPFSDDTSTPREVAFEKIRIRVAGTAMAAKILAGAAQ